MNIGLVARSKILHASLKLEFTQAKLDKRNIQHIARVCV